MQNNRLRLFCQENSGIRGDGELEGSQGTCPHDSQLMSYNVPITVDTRISVVPVFRTPTRPA